MVSQQHLLLWVPLRTEHLPPAMDKHLLQLLSYGDRVPSQEAQ